MSLHEGNLFPRVAERYFGLLHYELGAEDRIEASVEPGGAAVGVVFDLDDPEQAGRLASHTAAFGSRHTEVEPLVDGKVVLKIYPGGAKEVL